MPYFEDPSLLVKAGRPDLAERLSILKNSHGDFQVNICLLSLRRHSDAIDESINAFRDSYKNSDANFFYISQEEILHKFKILVESEGGIPEDVLHFEGGHFEDSGSYGRAWIGSISAIELTRLYTAYQDTLFAGNIRLFLGSRKGGINEQIMTTAKDAPGNFWAINNGVTIVADTITPKKGSSTLSLTRFSIVNGCQTTSCLAKSNANKSVKVLARVIAAKASLRNEIVRYNNSQNAVKIWTVRAADDVQMELRKEFETFDIDYAPKQQGSRKTKKPDLIELDRAAKYLAACQQQYLIQAINKKSELFDQPYQKIF